MKKTAIGLLIFASFSVNSASFDCSKEPSKVGQLICNTPELSKMDDELYVDYLQAKLVTGNNAEFKKLVKQNWKLRQDNCETVECISDWYKRSTILYRNIANSGKVNNSSENCYEEGQQITLSGIIKRTVFPGPPNYESVELGDKPETYWVLNTKDPITCAKGSADWGSKNQLQLVLSDDLYKKYENSLNNSVSVTGKLMYSMTGHHHTPLMINVQSIQIRNEKAINTKVTYDAYGLPLPRNKEAFNNFNTVAISIINDIERRKQKENVINDSELKGVSSSVSTTQLYKEYKQNELVANNKYKGKRIRVVGIVESVTEDFLGNASVKSTSPDFILGGTMFNVDKEDPYVLSMVPGSKVDMVCIGGGFVMDSPILKDCVSTINFSKTNKKNRYDDLRKLMPYVIYMSSEDIVEKQCINMDSCVKYKRLADLVISGNEDKSSVREEELLGVMENLGLNREILSQVDENMNKFMNKYSNELLNKYE
ncbi:TPA: DUF4431 domain-containing protein [Proteus mirabilis]